MVEGNETVFFESEEYIKGAHFSVTMYIMMADGPDENVEVSWHLKTLSDFDNFGNGSHHFEIDATQIDFRWAHVYTDIWVDYVVTVTYPPN